jgi:hypothetical protein
LNDIGRNCLLGYRKKIAKFLMRTFTCRSTFLYDCCCLPARFLDKETKILFPFNDIFNAIKKCT